MSDETVTFPSEPAPEQLPAGNPPAPGGQPAAPVWLTAKNGRRFLRIPGVGGYAGVVWQAGPEETIDEALARKRRGGNQRPPKSRKRRVVEDAAEAAAAKVRDKPTPDSRSATTRAIASMMEDILCAPAIPCAGFGFEWEADHFTVQGERFAANIARTSERNPWLRKKLESGLEGEQNVVAILTTVNLAAAAVGYVLPPLIKWGVIPAPDTARRAFGLPLPPGPPRPPVPAAPAYQPPPVVDVMQNAVRAWEAAEQAAGQASPGHDAAYRAGNGDGTQPIDGGVS